MATGSSSDSINKAQSVRGRPEVGTVEPKVGAFVPRRDHNPRELKSWAKRTGFVSNFSGETVGSSSGRNESGGGFDLERGGRGGSGSSPKIEIDPVLGRTKPTRGVEIEAVGVRSESEEAMRVERRGRRSEDEPVLGRDEERSVGSNGNGVVGGGVAGEAKKMDEANGREGMQLYEGDEREGMQLYEEGEEGVHGGWGRPSAMRIRLRENPGFG